MNCCRSLLLATLLAGISLPARGQGLATDSQPKPQSAADEARQERLLPKPLEAIESNIRDLEANGFLSIVSGSYRVINGGQDQAIVWTIKSNRSLTCRYIAMQIEALSDVRLYKTLGADTNDPLLLEVHSMRLYFTPSLEQRASNSELFARDDIFEIWVYLDPIEVRQIRGLSADRAIFRAPKRR